MSSQGLHSFRSSFQLLSLKSDNCLNMVSFISEKKVAASVLLLLYPTQNLYAVLTANSVYY